jgi:hypothetical protein
MHERFVEPAADLILPQIVRDANFKWLHGVWFSKGVAG